MSLIGQQQQLAWLTVLAGSFYDNQTNLLLELVLVVTGANSHQHGIANDARAAGLLSDRVLVPDDIRDVVFHSGNEPRLRIENRSQQALFLIATMSLSLLKRP